MSHSCCPPNSFFVPSIIHWKKTSCVPSRIHWKKTSCVPSRIHWKKLLAFPPEFTGKNNRRNTRRFVPSAIPRTQIFVSARTNKRHLIITTAGARVTSVTSGRTPAALRVRCLHTRGLKRPVSKHQRRRARDALGAVSPGRGHAAPRRRSGCASSHAPRTAEAATSPRIVVLTSGGGRRRRERTKTRTKSGRTHATVARVPLFDTLF